MNFKINRKFPPNSEDLSPVKWKECANDPKYILVGFKYLDDLKERGAKIIIGDFYEEVARKVMFPCEQRIDNVVIKQSMVNLAGDVSSI